MRRRKRHETPVGMQMGPMIDMVFLLLVFFMVSARPKKDEAEINLGLPGTVAQEEALDIPDEQKIRITDDRQVLLNDEAMDTPQSTDLPQLLQALTRFKESADLSGSQALVTVDPGDAVPHQRLVDVMNVCAKAGIRDVSFSGLETEEEEP